MEYLRIKNRKHGTVSVITQKAWDTIFKNSRKLFTVMERFNKPEEANSPVKGPAADTSNKEAAKAAKEAKAAEEAAKAEAAKMNKPE